MPFYQLKKQKRCRDILTDHWVFLDLKYDENWITFFWFFIAYKQLEVDTVLSKTNTVAHLVNFNDKSFLNNDTWWQYHSIIMSDLKKVPITDGDQTRSFNWKSILSLNLTSECNKCTVYKKSSASSMTLKNNCVNLC